MEGSYKVKGQLNNKLHRTTEMKAAREEDYITNKEVQLREQVKVNRNTEIKENWAVCGRHLKNEDKRGQTHRLLHIELSAIELCSFV